MECVQCRDVVSSLVDDEGVELEVRAARRHLVTCTHCCAWVVLVLELHDHLLAAGFGIGSHDAVRHRLARLAHPAGSLRIPPAPPSDHRSGCVVPLRRVAPRP